jgi:ferredoxin
MPDPNHPPVVLIDRDLCIGSGVCLVYASGTFTHDAELKAVMVDQVTDTVEAIRVAVEACPTGALSMSNHESGE